VTTRPRIALLSHHDPLNRNSFSGTAFFMRRALMERAEVTVPGAAAHARARGLLARLRRQAERRLTGRKNPDAARRRRAFLAMVRRDLARGDDEVVLGIVSSGLLADLGPEAGLPLIHVTDATPGYIAEAYDTPPRPGAVDVERRAILASRAVIYSSHYMAERARAEFGADAEGKLHVVPFGLNLDAPPRPRLDLAAPGDGMPLRLVFLGKKWARKGGDIALDTLRWLRTQGVDARLTVLGSRPPGYRDPEGGDASTEGLLEEGVSVIPFLDKNRPSDAARFEAVMGAAHALILPTRADCTPMVVAEANAFGAPALATDVGGLGTLIAPGRNGWLMAPEDRGAEWGRRVLDMVADPHAYAALRRAALGHYRDHLTWEAWSAGVLRVASDLARP
jgi:glycosyltransferase involved in cell wall biosynthesis